MKKLAWLTLIFPSPQTIADLFVKEHTHFLPHLGHYNVSELGSQRCIA